MTGIFVEVDANDVWVQQQHPYTHTLFDRIGPAARQGNASAQISLPSPPAPAVTNFDIATLNILPTRLNLNTFQSQQTRLNNAYQNYQAIQPAYQALPTTGTLTAAQQVVAQQAATLSKYVVIAENEMITMAYDGAADRLAGQLDTGYYVAHLSQRAARHHRQQLDRFLRQRAVLPGCSEERHVRRGRRYQNRNVVRTPNGRPVTRKWPAAWSNPPWRRRFSRRSPDPPTPSISEP